MVSMVAGRKMADAKLRDKHRLSLLKVKVEKIKLSPYIICGALAVYKKVYARPINIIIPRIVLLY